MSQIKDIILEKFFDFLKNGPALPDSLLKDENFAQMGAYRDLLKAAAPSQESMEILMKHALRAELELLIGMQKAVQSSLDSLDAYSAAAARARKEKAERAAAPATATEEKPPAKVKIPVKKAAKAGS